MLGYVEFYYTVNWPSVFARRVQNFSDLVILVQREHFQIRGQTEVGRENWRFSTDKSSYLRNGER